MNAAESKGLKKGNRVYWRGDATDSGIITELSWDAVTIAGAVGFSGARWISRMSPWCTVATLPSSQAIVTASQLISVIMPLSVASPRQ